MLVVKGSELPFLASAAVLLHPSTSRGKRDSKQAPSGDMLPQLLTSLIFLLSPHGSMLRSFLG